MVVMIRVFFAAERPAVIWIVLPMPKIEGLLAPNTSAVIASIANFSSKLFSVAAMRNAPDKPGRKCDSCAGGIGPS